MEQVREKLNSYDKDPSLNEGQRRRVAAMIEAGIFKSQTPADVNAREERARAKLKAKYDLERSIVMAYWQPLIPEMQLTVDEPLVNRFKGRKGREVDEGNGALPK